MKKDGEHKSDSQLVEYSFSLIPSGRWQKTTKWKTNMCLMISWNYSSNLDIAIK